LSFQTEAQISALRAEIVAGRNPKDAKVLLAKEITARFHSAAAADAALQDFTNRSLGGVPDEIAEVGLSGAPLGLAQMLKQAGLAPSASEANRLIDGNGVRVDSVVVTDKGLKLAAGSYVVQVGKRRFARVVLG
jgi:tyrosyl-tRNA synthetase